MNIKNRIKVSISNIPKAVKPIPGIQDSLITRSGRVFLKERGVWYEIIPMGISFYPSLGMVKRIIYMVKEVLNPLGR